MTIQQLWRQFVQKGFICNDMDGARHAFEAGYRIASGTDAKVADDDAIRHKIEEEIGYIREDKYTRQCLMDMGVGGERMQQLLQDFATQCFAKMLTHHTHQMAREHFINYCNIMKDKTNGTNDKQVEAAKWRDDILDRMARLSGRP